MSKRFFPLLFLASVLLHAGVAYRAITNEVYSLSVPEDIIVSGLEKSDRPDYDITTLWDGQKKTQLWITQLSTAAAFGAFTSWTPELEDRVTGPCNRDYMDGHTRCQVVDHKTFKTNGGMEGWEITLKYLEYRHSNGISEPGKLTISRTLETPVYLIKLPIIESEFFGLVTRPNYEMDGLSRKKIRPIIKSIRLSSSGITKH